MASEAYSSELESATRKEREDKEVLSESSNKNFNELVPEETKNVEINKVEPTTDKTLETIDYIGEKDNIKVEPDIKVNPLNNVTKGDDGTVRDDNFLETPSVHKLSTEEESSVQKDSEKANLQILPQRELSENEILREAKLEDQSASIVATTDINDQVYDGTKTAHEDEDTVNQIINKEQSVTDHSPQTIGEETANRYQEDETKEEKPIPGKGEGLETISGGQDIREPAQVEDRDQDSASTREGIVTESTKENEMVEKVPTQEEHEILQKVDGGKDVGIQITEHDGTAMKNFASPKEITHEDSCEKNESSNPNIEVSENIDDVQDKQPLSEKGHVNETSEETRVHESTREIEAEEEYKSVQSNTNTESETIVQDANTNLPSSTQLEENLKEEERDKTELKEEVKNSETEHPNYPTEESKIDNLKDGENSNHSCDTQDPMGTLNETPPTKSNEDLVENSSVSDVYEKKVEEQSLEKEELPVTGVVQETIVDESKHAKPSELGDSKKIDILEDEYGEETAHEAQTQNRDTLPNSIDEQEVSACELPSDYISEQKPEASIIESEHVELPEGLKASEVDDQEDIVKLVTSEEHKSTGMELNEEQLKKEEPINDTSNEVDTGDQSSENEVSETRSTSTVIEKNPISIQPREQSGRDAESVVDDQNIQTITETDNIKAAESKYNVKELDLEPDEENISGREFQIGNREMKEEAEPHFEKENPINKTTDGIATVKDDIFEEKSQKNSSEPQVSEKIEKVILEPSETIVAEVREETGLEEAEIEEKRKVDSADLATEQGPTIGTHETGLNNVDDKAELEESRNLGEPNKEIQTVEHGDGEHGTDVGEETKEESSSATNEVKEPEMENPISIQPREQSGYDTESVADDQSIQITTESNKIKTDEGKDYVKERSLEPVEENISGLEFQIGNREMKEEVEPHFEEKNHINKTKDDILEEETKPNSSVPQVSEKIEEGILKPPETTVAEESEEIGLEKVEIEDKLQVDNADLATEWQGPTTGTHKTGSNDVDDKAELEESRDLGEPNMAIQTAEHGDGEYGTDVGVKITEKDDTPMEKFVASAREERKEESSSDANEDKEPKMENPISIQPREQSGCDTESVADVQGIQTLTETNNIKIDKGKDHVTEQSLDPVGENISGHEFQIGNREMKEEVDPRFEEENHINKTKGGIETVKDDILEKETQPNSSVPQVSERGILEPSETIVAEVIEETGLEEAEIEEKLQVDSSNLATEQGPTTGIHETGSNDVDNKTKLEEARDLRETNMIQTAEHGDEEYGTDAGVKIPQKDDTAVEKFVASAGEETKEESSCDTKEDEEPHIENPISIQPREQSGCGTESVADDQRIQTITEPKKIDEGKDLVTEQSLEPVGENIGGHEFQIGNREMKEEVELHSEEENHINKTNDGIETIKDNILEEETQPNYSVPQVSEKIEEGILEPSETIVAEVTERGLEEAKIEEKLQVESSDLATEQGPTIGIHETGSNDVDNKTKLEEARDLGETNMQIQTAEQGGEEYGTDDGDKISQKDDTAVEKFVASAGEETKEESSCDTKEDEEPHIEAREEHKSALLETEDKKIEESDNTNSPLLTVLEKSNEENSKEEERDLLESKEEVKNSATEQTFDSTCSTEETKREALPDEKIENRDFHIQGPTGTLSDTHQNEDHVENSSVPDVYERETEEEILEKAESTVTGVIEETNSDKSKDSKEEKVPSTEMEKEKMEDENPVNNTSNDADNISTYSEKTILEQDFSNANFKDSIKEDSELEKVNEVETVVHTNEFDTSEPNKQSVIEDQNNKIDTETNQIKVEEGMDGVRDQEMKSVRENIAGENTQHEEIIAESPKEEENVVELPKQEVHQIKVIGKDGSTATEDLAASAGEETEGESSCGKNEDKERDVEAREEHNSAQENLETEDKIIEEGANTNPPPSTVVEKSNEENSKKEERDLLEPKEEVKNSATEHIEQTFDSTCSAEETKREALQDAKIENRDFHMQGPTGTLSETHQNEDRVENSSVPDVNEREMEEEIVEKSQSTVTGVIEETSTDKSKDSKEEETTSTEVEKENMEDENPVNVHIMQDTQHEEIIAESPKEEENVAEFPKQEVHQIKIIEQDDSTVTEDLAASAGEETNGESSCGKNEDKECDIEVPETNNEVHGTITQVIKETDSYKDCSTEFFGEKTNQNTSQEDEATEEFKDASENLETVNQNIDRSINADLPSSTEPEESTEEDLKEEDIHNIEPKEEITDTEQRGQSLNNTYPSEETKAETLIDETNPVQESYTQGPTGKPNDTPQDKTSDDLVENSSVPDGCEKVEEILGKPESTVTSITEESSINDSEDVEHPQVIKTSEGVDKLVEEKSPISELEKAQREDDKSVNGASNEACKASTDDEKVNLALECSDRSINLKEVEKSVIEEEAAGHSHEIEASETKSASNIAEENPTSIDPGVQPLCEPESVVEDQSIQTLPETDIEIDEGSDIVKDRSLESATENVTAHESQGRKEMNEKVVSVDDDNKTKETETINDEIVADVCPENTSAPQLSEKTEEEILEKVETEVTGVKEETSLKECEGEDKLQLDSTDLAAEGTGLITTGPHEIGSDDVDTITKLEDEREVSTAETPRDYTSEESLEVSSTPSSRDQNLTETEVGETKDKNPEDIETPYVNTDIILATEATEEKLLQQEVTDERDEAGMVSTGIENDDEIEKHIQDQAVASTGEETIVESIKEDVAELPKQEVNIIPQRASGEKEIGTEAIEKDGTASENVAYAGEETTEGFSRKNKAEEPDMEAPGKNNEVNDTKVSIPKEIGDDKDFSRESYEEKTFQESSQEDEAIGTENENVEESANTNLPFSAILQKLILENMKEEESSVRKPDDVESKDQHAEDSSLSENKNTQILTAATDVTEEAAEKTADETHNENQLDSSPQSRDEREVSTREISPDYISEQNLQTSSIEHNLMATEQSETTEDSEKVEEEKSPSTELLNDKLEDGKPVNEASNEDNMRIDTENTIPEQEFSSGNSKISPKEDAEIEKAVDKKEAGGHGDETEDAETKNASVITQEMTDSDPVQTESIEATESREITETVESQATKDHNLGSEASSPIKAPEEDIKKDIENTINVPRSIEQNIEETDSCDDNKYIAPSGTEVTVPEKGQLGDVSISTFATTSEDKSLANEVTHSSLQGEEIDSVKSEETSGDLTEKIQEPSYAMLSPEQDHDSTSEIEKIKEESPSKDETLETKILEGYSATQDKEKTYLQKEYPSEVEDSKLEIGLIQDKHEVNPYEAPKKEGMNLVDASVETQENVSMINFADSAPEAKQEIIDATIESKTYEDQNRKDSDDTIDTAKNELSSEKAYSPEFELETHGKGITGDNYKEDLTTNDVQSTSAEDSILAKESAHEVVKEAIEHNHEDPIHETVEEYDAEKDISKEDTGTSESLKDDEKPKHSPLELASDKSDVTKDLNPKEQEVCATEVVSLSPIESLQKETDENENVLESKQRDFTFDKQVTEEATVKEEVEHVKDEEPVEFSTTASEGRVTQAQNETINDSPPTNNAGTDIMYGTEDLSTVSGITQDIAKPSLPLFEKQGLVEKNSNESPTTMGSTGDKDVPLVQQNLKEKPIEGEVEDLNSRNTSEATPEANKEQQADKTETDEVKEAKHDKDGDEDEDEHKEGDENKRVDSGSDAPVMVEASRDLDVKVVAHKKSHGILSGVGSKVKHSIAKVKKVITGKSSSPKQSSPK